MKKLLVLLLALTFVSAFVSAQDAAPVPEAKLVPEISGNATVTFGINLDNNATGFANATDSNIKLQLVTKATTEKGGKEGEEVYGWIKLKDFEIKIAKGDTPNLTASAPGIEAKLFLGPVYINILGDSHDTAKTNAQLDIGIIQTKGGDSTWDVLGLTTAAATAQDNVKTPEFAGLIIGLKDTSIVDVKLGVQSLADWLAHSATTYAVSASNSTTVLITTTTTTDAANTGNTYDLWLSVDLNAVPGLIFGVKGAFSLNDPAGTFYGVGTKLGYKVALADNINLIPEVGFDYRGDTIDATANSAWRFEGGVGLTLPGSKLDDWDKFGTSQDILPGATVIYAMGAAGSATATSDMEVTLFDGDLIPVVNLVAVGEFYDLTNTAGMSMGFGVFANADFGAVVPFGQFRYLSKQGTNTLTRMTVGFDLKVITNTTLTLQYVSGDLSDHTAGDKLGIITVACKIAF